jgi:hypothetical protein
LKHKADDALALKKGLQWLMRGAVDPKKLIANDGGQVDRAIADAAKKLDVRGTFNADIASRIGGGTIAERQLKVQEDILKENKKQNQQLGDLGRFD